jgi:hypothetical protein
MSVVFTQSGDKKNNGRQKSEVYPTGQKNTDSPARGNKRCYGFTADAKIAGIGNSTLSRF